MSNEGLPSIDDFAEDLSNLPSIDDYLTEEVSEELPSVSEFIVEEKEEIEEATQTIEDLDGNTFAEVKDIVPPWPELLRLVNDIREEIPDIPEIKYYDKELEDLEEQINLVKDQIPEVPEVRYYEAEIEAICEQIDLVKEVIEKNAADIPEIKYYDDQIKSLEERLDLVNQNIDELPEPKYYEGDLQSIREDIEEVKNQIPTFPKWVNEVNEVPDFSWIGKTFSVIDDDFIKVNDKIETVKQRLHIDFKEFTEENETKHFESGVEFGNKIEDLDKKFSDSKDRIWKELRESSLKIWEYHKEFKDDDKKLKKQIRNEYDLLKKNVHESIEKYVEDSVNTDQLLLKYFEELRKEVSELPEVKYYDEDIKDVKSSIKQLYEIVELIKSEQQNIQEELQEGLLNEPPNEKESVGGQADPLTPMDQKFATLDDLAGHYRLFINRIQQQISTIGGGGAGFIKDLDDVSFDQTTGTNKLLIYNGSQWVGIASTALPVSIPGISTTGTSTFNIIEGSSATFSGNVTVGGTITYDDVTFLDSVGVATARSGLEIGAGSITTLVTLGAATATTTTTSESNIDTFDASVFRSAQYQVQITQGSSYHVTTLNVLHDGSSVYLSEFGTIKTGSSLATFDADINSGNVRVRATPSSDTSTVFKVSKTLTKV
jgi:hypothetical protein